MAATDQTLEPAASTGMRRARGPYAGIKRGFSRWWFAYVMLLPVAIVMAALVFYPLVRGIMLSFTNADRFTLGNKFIPSTYHYIGIRNYTDILTSSEFRRVALFTVIWTFVNVFFHFTIGLVLALTLNRQLRFRGLYRILLMVPWAVPTFISAFAWRFMYNNPYGFFDQLLLKLGWDNPPAFLGDPNWAKFAVILTNVWIGVPFMMTALLGGLQAIDSELVDASAVDGASAWRRFWDVTMPGLRPVAATVVLLGLIWTFNMFNIIFLITAGGPANSTQIFATFAYRSAFTDYLFGQAAAWGVILLSMLLVFGTTYRWAVARSGEDTWA